MLKQWMYGATLSLAVVAMTACSSSKKSGGASMQDGVLGVEAVSILSRTAGSSTKLTEPGPYLINDATTLENFGAKELVDINVNFDDQSLIVLALGECPSGGYWAHIDGVQQLGDTVIVQGTANRPTKAQGKDKTYPFEAVVVSKVRGMVVPDIASVEDQEHPSDVVAEEKAEEKVEAAAEAVVEEKAAE